MEKLTHWIQIIKGVGISLKNQGGYWYNQTIALFAGFYCTF